MTDKTIFEEISDAYPNLNNTKIRNALAAFSVYRMMMCLSGSVILSGGERGRVSLAKLMLSRCQLPDSGRAHQPSGYSCPRKFWKQALNHYTGTVLYRIP